MFVDGFIWLPEIIDKLAAKHRVTPEEAEEIFFNGPRFRFVERGHQDGEDVYVAAGQTEAGRYLVVFFILKRDGRAMILSGRDMDKAERRRHGRS